MARNYSKPNTDLHYRGKVRVIDQNEVTVSVFAGEEEVIGELRRDYFPKRLKVGAVFNYHYAAEDKSVKIEMVKPKIPTRQQLRKLEREIRARIDLDNI